MIEQDTSKTLTEWQISSVIAMFRNFSPEKPVGNAVVYFWESHTNNHDDKEKHQAAIELIYKEFDMCSCEKYEVRTGYLNRHNFLSKPMTESSIAEIEEAIIKGQRGEEDWVNRCTPELPGFQLKDWRECISKENNPRLEDCRKLIIKKIQDNQEFADAFSRTVNEYAEKHKTNAVNGNAYMLEELSWILSLPLLHLNKPIYLIHVGLDGLAIRALFHHFSNLQKAVKWLSPKFTTTIFENESDFLMDYRNSIHVGYSYAIENREIVKSIVTVRKEEDDSTKEELTLSLSREINEKNMLYSIIEKLPGHVYWLSHDNVYLGCNDLQAQNYGLQSRRDIIGKTNKDFFPIKDANILDKNNIMVMETGIPYEGDEPVIMQGRYGSYLSRKIPLRDTHGKVIGLLGLSIDITDRKKAESLELQSRLQQVRLEEQEEFRQFTSRIAHDVVSPLVSLDSILNSCDDLPEKQRISLRNAITDIRNIVDTLLIRYKQDEQYRESLEIQHVLISLALLETVSQKRLEYQDKNIDIHYIPDPALNFTFIAGDQYHFRRMLSNLINNAVEATDGKHGVIDISLRVENGNVIIDIKDNGRGMPKETIAKILNNEPVGTTKATGHGLGLQQIKDTVGLYKGKMSISSEEGFGTTFTLTFPISSAPRWIANRVNLRKGQILLVLDDDKAIHDFWECRLRSYMQDVNVRFFQKMKEAAKFIDSLQHNERSNLLILSDYDLRESKTGLHFILENDMKNQAMIVTSIHNDKTVQENIDICGMQMIPKQFLNDIVITVE